MDTQTLLVNRLAHKAFTYLYGLHRPLIIGRMGVSSDAFAEARRNCATAQGAPRSSGRICYRATGRETAALRRRGVQYYEEASVELFEKKKSGSLFLDRRSSAGVFDLLFRTQAERQPRSPGANEDNTSFERNGAYPLPGFDRAVDRCGDFAVYIHS